MNVIIRPAQKADVAQITDLVNRFAAKNIMLPRSEANVDQTIADWLVAIEIDEITASYAPMRIDTLGNNNEISHEMVDNDLDNSPERIESSRANRESQRVVGCGALVPLNDTLVEIRSLAIDESQHGKGLGSALVLHLVDLAREREYKQVCALTLRPAFFIRLGFALVDRWSISPKVWQACIYCPKFHRCDEVAVLINLDTPSTYHTGKEGNRQPGWNRLLKWEEWQPLRLAYQHRDKEEHPQ